MRQLQHTTVVQNHTASIFTIPFVGGVFSIYFGTFIMKQCMKLVKTRYRLNLRASLP